MLLEQLVLVWINKLMEPERAGVTWGDTYTTTAHEIAEVSETSPLFAGEDGPTRTASVLTSNYYYESRFNPTAIGDHGHSFGLGQISDGNFGWLGITREGLLKSTRLQVETSLRLVKMSFKYCGGKPIEEKLGWYASGGMTCGRAANSRMKMGLAKRLYASASE